MRVWRFVTVVVICLVAFPLSAVGQDYSRYAGVTLRAMMEPHPSTTALKMLVSEFEAETGIKVILEEVPYEHLPEKALLNFVTRSPEYDIIHDDWLFKGYGYARAGYLADLTPYTKDPNLNRWYDPSDFLPGLIDEMTVDGKLYGVPLYADSTFMMYRRDVLAAKGVGVPQTMSELRTAVAKVHGNNIYGITLRGKRGIHMAWLWGNFLVAFGGRYLDEQYRPVINSPEAVAAGEFYIDLMKNFAPPGAANYGWEENRIAFEQGRAAFTIDASVNAGFAEDPSKSAVAGKVGYALIPRGPAGYGGNISMHSLYVSNFSRNKEAAFLFITWATHKTTQLKALALEPNSSLTSVSVIRSEPYQRKFGKFAQVHFDAIRFGNYSYIPKVPEAMELADTVSLYLSESLTGMRSVSSALDEAAKAIYAILERAGYYKR